MRRAFFSGAVAALLVLSALGCAITTAQADTTQTVALSGQYAVWPDNDSGPGVPAANLAADGDGDGDVDDNDYGVWKSHFGEVAGGAGAGLANRHSAIRNQTPCPNRRQ